MRTTLDIDDQIYQAAKLKAATKGTTLTRIVEDALREFLRPSKPEKPYEFRWPTMRGRLLPGVNIDDRDSLYDLMEGRS